MEMTTGFSGKTEKLVLSEMVDTLHENHPPLSGSIPF